MKTANDFIKELEDSGIMTSNECTFKEYVNELKKFQTMVCKMIAGDLFCEDMRINEAITIMTRKAREYGLRNNHAVNEAINTLEKLNKEIAIAMSGANGERFVAKTLERLERPNTRIFQNIYITDGLDETELDNVILTDKGIIVLEVKKVKCDITLTTEGRMMFNDECYGKMPLGDKMKLKRQLLKERIEKTVADMGLNIPVCIDSFIVFTAPKNIYIKVNDQYRREKFCFRSTLNRTIESYSGDIHYDNDALSKLEEIISKMESNVKRFESKLDFDDVRNSIAKAMTVLYNASEEKKQTSVLETDMKTAETKDSKIIGFDSHETIKQKIGYSVSIVGGLIISGALVAFGISKMKRT